VYNNIIVYISVFAKGEAIAEQRRMDTEMKKAMKNKQFLAGLLASTMLVTSLTACSKKEDDTEALEGVPFIFAYDNNVYVADENYKGSLDGNLMLDALFPGQSLNKSPQAAGTLPEPQPVLTEPETGAVVRRNKTFTTLWYDISKGMKTPDDPNYNYNGEAFTITFKIRDDAANGESEVGFIVSEFSDDDGRITALDDGMLYAENGSVNVGGTARENVGRVDSVPFIWISHASGKQGDEVTLTVSTKNVPGFCGFRHQIEYDENVLQLVTIKANPEFAGIISNKK
jgi:hypothetical protein